MLVGTNYHPSAMSFSSKSTMKTGIQSKGAVASTIHQTYNGSSGLHSHNSSIHSSHMKTRSPGTSQLSTIHNNPQQHQAANASHIIV